MKINTVVDGGMQAVVSVHPASIKGPFDCPNCTKP